MWPLILGFARSYAVYITFPVAAVIGVIGYSIESYVRGNKQTPWRERGIKDDRDERIWAENSDKDCSEVDSLKSRKDIPQTILHRNDFKR